MKEKENLLKNLSLNVINKWIKFENNEGKKEAFRCLKSEKLKYDKPKMAEIIRAIPERLLNPEVIGFINYEKKIINFLESNAIELERSYAEFDERYRQIVCNAVLITEDNSEYKYFGFLQRNKEYTESSLIGTVGMAGGHYNNNDNNLYTCLLREISEEIKGIHFEDAKITPLGVIKESSDTISNYHICMLYSVNVPMEIMGRAKSRESQESLIWFSQEELKNILEKDTSHEFILDSWCKIAAEVLMNNSCSIK